MNWETIKMWVSNPIGTYRDQQAIRKAELRDIENYLVHTNEERAAEGFPVQPMKQIKESAKRILENREQNRTAPDVARLIQDLRAGKKLREKREHREAQKERDGYER